MKPTIGIIGFGVVGKAIQHGFSEVADFRIYDKNPLISENSLKDTVTDSDFIFICVPTPMDRETGKCDTSIVEEVIYSCIPYARFKKKIIIIKSTIPPGTTKKLIQELRELRIVFNPEFLTERLAKLDFINTSRIILGGKLMDVELVEELYRLRFPHTPIYKTTPTTAEMVKYTCNTFFCTKLSFFNEIYDICKETGVDYDEMIEMVLLDGRIGNSHYSIPGHDGNRGFGGLCFPKDINALIAKAKGLDIDPIVMEAVWEKNLRIRENKDWEKRKGAISG